MINKLKQRYNNWLAKKAAEVPKYLSGNKSRAVCPYCAKLVTTTFAHHDVLFDDDRGTVKDILVADCDECNAIVAVPAQSTPAIHLNM